MRNFLLKLLTPKRRTTIAALLPEGERQAAYLHAPGHPLLAAITSDLDQLIFDKSDEALGEELTEVQVRYRLGGQDALLAFKERLAERLKEAQLTQAQLDAKRQAEQNQTEEDED